MMKTKETNLMNQYEKLI